MLESRALLSAVSGAVFQDLDVNGFRNTDLIQGDEPDVIFIIDASGSTGNPFTGMPVGDLNNDGDADTILDAEIAAFTALNQQLINQGVGDTAQVGIVMLANDLGGLRPDAESQVLDVDPLTPGIQLTAAPNADKDSNGVPDIVQTLQSIQRQQRTAYKDALGLAHQLTIDAGFNDPSDVNVIFLSDGIPTNNDQSDFAAELADLNAAADNIRAFGVGGDTDLFYLKQIDPNAQIFNSTDEIVGVFGGISPDLTIFTEPGIDGRTVELLDAGGTVVASTVTASVDLDGSGDINPNSEQGLYSFDLAALGLSETADYTVQVVTPSGFRNTYPVGGIHEVTVNGPTDDRGLLSFGSAINEPPVINVNAISIAEGGTVTLSPSQLAAHDPDNSPDELTFAVSNLSGGQFELTTNPGVAITTFTQQQINDGQVAFVHDGSEAGPTYDLVVSDGDLSSVSSSVAIGTFTTVNDAPIVANPTGDISFNEDDLFEQTIDLTTVFADPDSSLTYHVSDSGFPQNGTFGAFIDGTDLKMIFGVDRAGSGTVTVTANDGEFSISDEFTVTISPVNEAPDAGSVIGVEDIILNEDAADVAVDLTLAVFDPDTIYGSGLFPTYSVSSSNPSLATLSLSDIATNAGPNVNGLLTIDFAPDANGTATITITADDGEFSDSSTFLVTVNAVNDAPIMANPIADVTVSEDATDQVIDLSSVFADIDSSLTFTAVSSDDSVVITSLSGTGLTLSFPANANGTATVTVTANDGSLSVSDTFSVTVSAVNDAPAVANPIGDVTVNEDAADQVIDLSGVFADVDGDSLIWSAVSSDGSVVTTSLSGTDLTLSFPANANGSATVTVTANDGSLTVSDTFTVTVSAVNDAPTVANPIADVTVNEDAADQVIDLSGVFADVDSSLTLTVVSSDGSVVTTSLSGTDLTLSFPPNANGTATVTVTADDGALSVSDTFSVTVSAVNDAPTVANPIADVTVNEDAADQVIDLSGVFADLDGDALTLTAVSSDGSVVTTSLSGTNLTLNFPANANGSATVTVTADDGYLTVSDTLSVTVIQSNQAPVVTSDGDVTVNEGGLAMASGEWSDPDGDEVTLSASIGAVTRNADGTWTWTYNTADGPDDSASVTITAVDTGNESAVVSFDMAVNNVAPSVTSLTSTAVTVEDAAGDGEVEISGSFFDPGDDTHTVTIDWGDGHVEVVTVDEANQLFSGSHTYATGGLYEVSVTIVDSDGAATAQPSVTQAYVQGVGLVDGTLYLIGTDGDDHVKVRYDSRNDEIDVDMKLDFRGRGSRGCGGKFGRRYDVRIRGSFDAAEIDHIVVFLGAGDDFYDGEVGKDHGCRHGHRRTDAISQIVFGGSGDDQIFTGIGNDFVDGGSGRDHIHSDDGRDILVGGTGRDHIKGGRGDDLLIGGSLEMDWENSFELSAIDSALAEWANGNLADTMDILGSVLDDEERDDLFGDQGRDTYITGRYDRRRG